jgi:hypothetical protein
MNNPNPFSPPTAPVADVAADRPYPETLRIVFLVLLLVQAAGSWYLADMYWNLVRTGAAPGLALLLMLPGTLCLYAGAAFVAGKRPRGLVTFVAAAVLLGGSVPLWGWPYPWAWLAGLGALVAALGACVAARSRP